VGNQTYFTIENTFSNLNFYEFVSDQYATVQWDHNWRYFLPNSIYAKTELEKSLE
jgi:DNA-binding transcriptional regulator/RsmH inhibitor MraZ